MSRPLAGRLHSWQIGRAAARLFYMPGPSAPAGVYAWRCAPCWCGIGCVVGGSAQESRRKSCWKPCWGNLHALDTAEVAVFK